jgi:hypothetical protein
VFCGHRVPCDYHLRLKLSNNGTSHQRDGDAMLRAAATRGVFVRAVCVLCVALVCVIGTLQATHSHPENSSTSHHACTICATAHAGLSTTSATLAPALATSALSSLVTELSTTFRPAATQFIRPPPAA